ncbi:MULTISPECIES: hypothetical protein [unclassified Sphingomonas]|uniref:hypothetical protein n=1 Tax=unclassified Sphingomonas TaxID=196159 RepID=UPI0006F92CB0|nr:MULTISPECIES: hypothetical protein [unclassified Sphingomonas]KQM61537.1 hypothetical protein ASE65_08435 [Sphingomonas sp. Leaf16]KQN12633.1 hypothetical protein ASE81_09445 [Sphingomonas sp. Leaf29]KQN19112.1 hypothetical protein ASE83_09370 [Sphingomonas sp. Leaf32]
MSRGPDATTLLERRLRIAAEAMGVSIAITASDQTGWASATFNGARHRLTLTSGDAGFAPWLAGLPEADLPLRGHLVADLIVTGQSTLPDGPAATIEALTVEER